MTRTPSSLATAREQRRDRLTRERKLAEPLGLRYPRVREIRLDLAFVDGVAATPPAQSHLLYAPARAFFRFPCPYADCSGQFDLSEIVASAIGASEQHAHGELVCDGLRPSPHVTTRGCELRLVYRVTALYS